MQANSIISVQNNVISECNNAIVMNFPKPEISAKLIGLFVTDYDDFLDAIEAAGLDEDTVYDYLMEVQPKYDKTHKVEYHEVEHDGITMGVHADIAADEWHPADDFMTGPMMEGEIDLCAITVGDKDILDHLTEEDKDTIKNILREEVAS